MGEYRSVKKIRSVEVGGWNVECGDWRVQGIRTPPLPVAKLEGGKGGGREPFAIQRTIHSLGG